MSLHHLTNVGPEAAWKIEKLLQKFPGLPIVYRDYPMTMSEGGEGYDEGVAILNNLHSMGFTRGLTDQEVFEVFTYWFNLKR